MLVRNMRSAFLAATAVASLVAGFAAPANAVPVVLDGWKFNLGNLNGQTWGTFNGAATADTISGMSNAVNIDQIALSGNSTVTQQLVSGGPVGGTFTDSGFLALTSYQTEPGGGLPINLPTGSNSVYFGFTGLTGTFTSAANGGTIVFNPCSSCVQLYLTDDGNINPLDGHSKVLATFDVTNPSGGSGLSFPFNGGSGGNGTIDITLLQTSGAIATLYQDSAGVNLPLNTTLHLGNVTALLASNVGPNPAFSGCTGSPPVCTQAVVQLSNGGHYNVAKDIPEPGTLSLLGGGLLLLGFGAWRRKATAS